MTGSQCDRGLDMKSGNTRRPGYAAAVESRIQHVPSQDIRMQRPSGFLAEYEILRTNVA